jgi:CheY-like chemotaxis protein
MMPKMKGSEVLKNLKAQVGFKTPVIALTADVISGMEDKYISQGFDDCLPKPIVEEELFYLLKKYLKEVTNVGLRSDSFVSIHTPNKVISPIVKEAVTFDEDFDLPKVLEKKETPKKLNTDFTISDDRFELIEKLNANKENPFEYAKVAANIKELAEYCGLKELASIAYENELAGKAFYQEFITDNYDKFINEIISNIEILKNYINKE